GRAAAVAVAVVAPPVRVAEGDRVVVGVGVPLHLLRIGHVDLRVDGHEPAGGRVVVAGAEVHQAVRFAGTTDEAFLARPRRYAATGRAERSLAPLDAGLCGGVDGEERRAVVVGGEPAHTGRGTYRHRTAGVAVIPGGGQRTGSGEAQFGVRQVQRGAAGVAPDQAVAVGVVPVRRGARIVGRRHQPVLGIPRQPLGAGTGPGERVAGRIVGVRHG